jgi:hypothetical protein
MRFIVWSPDGVPIRPTPFRSREAAERALAAWCQRFAAQGFYASVSGRISLGLLPSSCRIQEEKP